LWIRLTGYLRPGRGDQEFAAEIESHVSMHIEAGRRAGLSEAEARRRALIGLGGMEQARQAYRDRRGLPWLEDLLNDLHFSLRLAMRSPGFTVVAILTLAIGIGACATAFTWLNEVLLQPLSGVADPSRLVTVETVTSNGEWVPNSYPDFIDFRDHLKQFDGIAVSHPSAFSVGKEDHADRLWGELVSGNFFSVLGVQPEIGRLFLPSEYGDAPGAYPVAVISDRYWRSHFGADPAIAGKTIRINQHELTIVGVTQPAFHGTIPVTAFDVWVPYMEQAVLNGVQGWMLRDRHDRNMLGIARLKQGATFERANAELKALADRMAVANADVSEGMSAILLPIAKSPHGPQGLLAGPLRILMAVCVLLLLIVCANVANLLLARATVREKEFSARMALGARRGRIARQVLTESLMLAVAGAGLGLAITPWLAHALKLLMPTGPAIQQLVSMNTRPNLAVLAFTAGICILAALAAGMAPALEVNRIKLSARLNANGRSGVAGRGRNRLRSALVATEVALALVAMVGAGLLAKGFRQTMSIDPGFDPDHVMVNQFYLSTNGYNLVQRKEFCRRLEERMTAAPGVTDIAYSDGVPLGFEPSWWEELVVEGYAPRNNENMNIFRNVVSPGYLPLLHIPVVEGRNFTDQDNENAPNVMILNEAFVRRFFVGRNPIGHRIHGWGKWFRVIGVAKDSKYHYLGETTPAYVYVSFRQVFREDMNLAFYVRARGNPESLLTRLREQVRAIDPNVTVYDAVPLHEFIGASLYPQKVAASLMTVLGSLSLLLAAVGLYSVMAYSVAQRTQEIGVRMALGAQPAHVLRMVVRQGLALVVVGLAFGAVFAVGLERAVSLVSFTNSAMGVSNQLLPGNANDVLIYAAAALVLSAVAALAAYVPARRAARTDPMQALRTE
jgi:predicted permease